MNAGNVLVIEDNEPAAKWLALVNQSLNKPSKLVPKRTSSVGGSLFFAKPSLRKISKPFRSESKRRLKSCNCTAELERRHGKDLCCPLQLPNTGEVDVSSEDEEEGPNGFDILNSQMKYSLVASKQMVGIFVTIWMRTELVQYVSHMRICCISRGIMGCLGNKVVLKLFWPIICIKKNHMYDTCHDDMHCFVSGLYIRELSVPSDELLLYLQSLGIRRERGG